MARVLSRAAQTRPAAVGSLNRSAVLSVQTVCVQAMKAM